MNHRFVSAGVVLASAAALFATTCGTAGAAPNAKPGTAAVSAGATGATGATAWKPCHLPAGYQHIFELHSAKAAKGGTVVRVTPQTCKVNTHNDEDVAYTPSGAARSLGFASGASVKVLHDTTTVKVTPKWLATHKLANSPYFYYRVNSHHQITALEEIYHP
ncbi:hypothetical protein ABZ858_14285 [Streptomyces sp. NPDC047017]|uniref:hypothetical protein n=1 Tax=Streptomyces sp. NPDC047017 TaxID=3155024 RepID=UPI0033E945FC